MKEMSKICFHLLGGGICEHTLVSNPKLSAQDSFVSAPFLPVSHKQVGVVHLHHHQSLVISVAAREAIMPIRKLLLLHDHQHGWRLRCHKLAQAA